MANNSDIVLFQSVFRVGTVSSVDGREIKIKVDRDKNSSHLIYKGELIKNVSVSSYVKILKGFILIIGKVESEFIEPNKESQNSNYPSQEERIDRLLVVKLLGYIECDKYCRGIKELPLTNKDLLNLNLLCIFANATEKTQRPFIKRCIDLFKKIEQGKFNKQEKENHFKNIVRLQIKKILCMSDKLKSELLIKYVEQILPEKTDNNGIAVSLTSDIDFLNKNDGGYFLKNQRSNNFIQSNPTLAEQKELYQQVDNLSFSDNFIDIFIGVMYVRIIYDILGNDIEKNHIEPAIHKLESSAKDLEKLLDFSRHDNDFWKESNIVVVNLNNVNLDSKKMLPLLLARKLYSEHKEKQEKGKKESYLNIIVDEAHNILSYQSNRESETWKDYRLEVFEEIIKEGRKFGVFITIASQRPSDISETIISQLHNYFVHRLINEYDIKMVSKAISYLDKVSVESLPILSTGVCVIAGQLAEMPIVVQIDKIEDENKPLNETIDVISKWLGTKTESLEEIENESDNSNNTNDDDLPF